MRFRFRSVRSAEYVPLVVMAPSVISSCKLAGSISLSSRTSATSSELGVEKLSGREVHANRQGRYARVALLPDTCLLAGLSEHPLPDPHDQTSLLGDWKKLLGQQQSPLRMLPTHQRLYPGDLVVIKCHDGLVVDPELLPYECSPEPSLQHQALHSLSIHAGLEHLVASPAFMFGLVHRQVRMP